MCDYRFVGGLDTGPFSLSILGEGSFQKGHFIRVKNLWLMKGLLWQVGILRLLLRADYSAVIFFGDAHYLSTWFGVLIVRMRGKLVTMWTHGVRQREHGVKGALRMVFYRLGHGLLVYGERAKVLLKDRGFEESRIKVIYNSLNYPLQETLRKERSEARKRQALSDEVLVLIWSGRLVLGRKLDLLFDAVKRLKGWRPIRVLLVGDGPQGSYYRELAEEKGILEKVWFLGPVYEEKQLADLFCSADLCVCPGPVGLLAVHSMAYGVPVITNDDFARQGPEFEIIEPGITGAFFRDGDVEDLAGKIRELALTAGAMRERCWKRVEESYTPDRQRKLIEGALLEWGI